MSAQEETYWESVVAPMIHRWSEPLSDDEWAEFHLWWDEYAPIIRAGVGSSPIEQIFAIALILQTWRRPVLWEIKGRAKFVPGNWLSLDLGGDPTPCILAITPQYVTESGNRRDFALGAIWAGHIRVALLVECDSKEWHGDWESACNDRRRDRQDLSLGGPSVARFVGSDINRFPEKTANEALDMFMAQGHILGAPNAEEAESVPSLAESLYTVLVASGLAGMAEGELRKHDPDWRAGPAALFQLQATGRALHIGDMWVAYPADADAAF